MGDGQGEGEGNAAKLENQITVVKYLLLFTNATEWMVGVSVFAICLWLKLEPGIQGWLEDLDANSFYSGIYVLIFAAVVIMIVAFVGCLSALQENYLLVFIYIATQVIAFIFCLAGASVLLDNSARDSSFQPKIRDSIKRLMVDNYSSKSHETLSIIQESIGCCGADGPKDFKDLQQPIPSQCRDPVTGNAFYHGCVDELTWFFEQKCGWLAGLAMVLCLLHVINVVLSIILIQALKKEENEVEGFRK